MRSLSLLLALLGIGPLGGCNRPSFDTPVESYRSFHRFLQRGEERAAYGVLSRSTQEALARRMDQVVAASKGTVQRDPAAFFFANVPRPRDVTEVTLLHQEGDRARVQVVSSGRASEVRMVREPSGWKLDLSNALSP